MVIETNKQTNINEMVKIVRFAMRRGRCLLVLCWQRDRLLEITKLKLTEFTWNDNISHKTRSRVLFS